MRLLLLDLNDGRPNRGVPAMVAAARDAGLAIQVVDVRGGQPIPDSADAVLASGGPGSPHEDGPWAAPLRGFLLEALKARAPMLTICYGFQVLAAALALRVEPLESPRFGPAPIAATPDGLLDPWLARGLPGAAFEQRRFAVWRDQAPSPPAMVPLALGPEGDVTAARFGPRAVGCVFHPEAGRGELVAFLERPEAREKLVERNGPGAVDDALALLDPVEAAHRGLLRGWLAGLGGAQ